MERAQYRYLIGFKRVLFKARKVCDVFLTNSKVFWIRRHRSNGVVYMKFCKSVQGGAYYTEDGQCQADQSGSIYSFGETNLTADSPLMLRGCPFELRASTRNRT